MVSEVRKKVAASRLYSVEIQTTPRLSVVHREFVLADVPLTCGEESQTSLDSRLEWRLRQAILNTLYSRDSMSSESCVRSIRQRASGFGGRLEIYTEAIECTTVTLQHYLRQMQNKTIEQGFIFNEKVDLTF
jgi:hypothetical protein